MEENKGRRQDPTGCHRQRVENARKKEKEEQQGGRICAGEEHARGAAQATWCPGDSQRARARKLRENSEKRANKKRNEERERERRRKV